MKTEFYFKKIDNMPNDCLITKLKGVVSDSGLLKLGEIRLSMDLTYQNHRLTLATTGESKVQALGGATLSVEGTPVSNPYELTSSTTRVSVEHTGQDTAITSILGKYSLSMLDIEAATEMSESFDSIAKWGQMVALVFKDTKITGNLLSVIPLLASNTFSDLTIDSPLNVIEGGDIRNLFNQLALVRTSGYIVAATRAGTHVSDAITNIPAVLSGTYKGRRSYIYFTNDTVTYPHGWYGKNPNGTWYNANDEVITAPINP